MWKIKTRGLNVDVDSAFGHLFSRALSISTIESFSIKRIKQPFVETSTGSASVIIRDTYGWEFHAVATDELRRKLTDMIEALGFDPQHRGDDAFYAFRKP